MIASHQNLQKLIAGALLATSASAIGQSNRPPQLDAQTSMACPGVGVANLSCEAASAKAALDQARDADWQTWIGLGGALGLAASLIFSARATRAAFGAVAKADETLTETKRMNAIIVRPVVEIDAPWIDFDLHTYRPTIGFKTHNASDYPAHDWEWQVLLRYDGRASSLVPWPARGVHGIRLPAADRRATPHKEIQFPLEGGEIVDVTGLSEDEGLLVEMTLLTRCYDAFGNAVEDAHHFRARIHGLADAFGSTPRYLDRVPAGEAVATALT